jgi:hypothetical protein
MFIHNFSNHFKIFHIQLQVLQLETLLNKTSNFKTTIQIQLSRHPSNNHPIQILIKIQTRRIKKFQGF